MKIIASIFLISAIALHPCFSQSVKEIKADRSTYLWGEGSGNTLKKADQEALSSLISQISTQVESDFSLLKESVQVNGKEELRQICQSVVSTYSSATLKNTERIVLKNEPDAKVFRYIRRADVRKVFRDREEKIIGFSQNAESAISKNRVADGLRYYYWALTLLKSHPDGADIRFTDMTGTDRLLSTWLPAQINEVLDEVDISFSNIEKEEDFATITLDIRYRNQAAENFDYSFWDGADWSNLVSCKNGVGPVELYGLAANTEKLQIKAEYIFEGEARVDDELQDVLAKIDPIPFRKSYFNVPLKKLQGSSYEAVQKEEKNQYSSISRVIDERPYFSSIQRIVRAIKLGDYAAPKREFTADGYQVYLKLIQYGRARVIGSPELKFIQHEKGVICRSIPMSFQFKSNDRQFVENIVFHFNKSGKVENLSFSLSQKALDDILEKDMWDEHHRLTMISFLEFFKTAYALKRIDYIEQIFAEDALIITGSVFQVKANVENRFSSNRIVRYNRQSKQEYIQNLRYSFGSKEYINIKFEENRIKKAGTGGEIYGIQVKQHYFSSNYGDVGYLFLMVDLNNPRQPVIHVRTWQPDIHTSDQVYGFGDFTSG